MKWKLYWVTLIACLVGVLYWKNTKYYPNKAVKWQAGKSLIEGTLLVLAAVFAPPLLVIYGVMWLTKHIERPALRAGVGFGIGMVLMLMLSSVLELVILIGVFSVELISTDFLGYLQERRERRIHEIT